MMLKCKVLILAMAYLIVLSGLLRSVDVQILMYGSVPLLAFAVIEDKSRTWALQGLFFLRELFRIGVFARQRVGFWFGCCVRSCFGSAADTGLVRR